MFNGFEYENYKAKVDQLQKQIWKSEMERKELEIKFEELMMERSKCEKSAMKSIKKRYEKFVEEDRKRAARNTNLLKLLERIDYQAAALAAKTERLRLLKAQYELFLMKNWNGRNMSLQPQSQQSLIQPEKSSTIWSQSQQFPSSSTLSMNTLHPYFETPRAATVVHPSTAPQPPQPMQQHEGETNFKSDFVKYLSQINQFNPNNTYGMSLYGVTATGALADGTPTNPMDDAYIPNRFKASNIENFPANFSHLNGPVRCNATSGDTSTVTHVPSINYNYPLQYNTQICDGYEIKSDQKNDGDNGNGNFSRENLPKIQIQPATAAESYTNGNERRYESDQNRENQQPKTINNISEWGASVIAAALSRPSSDGALPFDFGNLLGNISSGGLQTGINNGAVSISNTSVNTTAPINTNEDIKAIHQNGDELNIPGKYQIDNSRMGNMENKAITNTVPSGVGRETGQGTLTAIDYGNQIISQVTGGNPSERESIYKMQKINTQTIPSTFGNIKQKELLQRHPDANIPTATSLSWNTDGTGKYQKPIFNNRNIKTYETKTRTKLSDGNGDAAGADAIPAAVIEQIEDVFYGEKIDYSTVGGGGGGGGNGSVSGKSNGITRINVPVTPSIPSDTNISTVSTAENVPKQFNNGIDINGSQQQQQNKNGNDGNTRNGKFNENIAERFDGNGEHKNAVNRKLPNANNIENIGSNKKTNSNRAPPKVDPSNIFKENVVEKHEIENENTEKENISNKIVAPTVAAISAIPATSIALASTKASMDGAVAPDEQNGYYSVSNQNKNESIEKSPGVGDKIENEGIKDNNNSNSVENEPKQELAVPLDQQIYEPSDGSELYQYDGNGTNDGGNYRTEEQLYDQNEQHQQQDAYENEKGQYQAVDQYDPNQQYAQYDNYGQENQEGYYQQDDDQANYIDQQYAQQDQSGYDQSYYEDPNQMQQIDGSNLEQVQGGQDGNAYYEQNQPYATIGEDGNPVIYGNEIYGEQTNIVAGNQQQQAGEEDQQQQQQQQQQQDYNNQQDEPQNYENYQYQIDPNAVPDQYADDEYGNITENVQPTQQNQEQYQQPPSDDAYYTQEPGVNYYDDDYSKNQQQEFGETMNEVSNNQNYGGNVGVSDGMGEEIDVGVTEQLQIPINEGGDDSSQTTYSDNVNLPQQLLGPAGGGGGGGGNGSSAQNPVMPGKMTGSTANLNYLESETDESSTAQQPIQQAAITGAAGNDESDFDFSAN